MATVTGKTSEKIDELFNSTIVSGALDEEGNLTFTRKGGSVIHAGSVSGSLVSAIINTAGRLILTRRNGTTIDAGNVGSKLIDSWPVGCIYMGVTPTNPSALLGGGTWVAWGAGRVPVGVDPTQPEFDAVEETGGTKTHVLSAAEMPTHTHTINHDHPTVNTSTDSHYHGVPSGTSTGTASAADRAGGGGAGNFNTTTDSHYHSVNVPAYAGSSGPAGSGAAHNNLQPYITCYMWRRTA